VLYDMGREHCDWSGFGGRMKGHHVGQVWDGAPASLVLRYEYRAKHGCLCQQFPVVEK
jgi:hypothetical protein